MVNPFGGGGVVKIFRCVFVRLFFSDLPSGLSRGGVCRGSCRRPVRLPAVRSSRRAGSHPVRSVCCLPAGCACAGCVVVAARLRAGRLHRRVGSAVVFRKSGTCLIFYVGCPAVPVRLSRTVCRGGGSCLTVWPGVVSLGCVVSAFRSAARLLPLRVNLGQSQDRLAYRLRQGVPSVDQGLQFGVFLQANG